MKTFAIDIRLLGKKRTGDEAVFFNLTKALLRIDKTNRYLLLTNEDRSEKIAALYGALGCIGQKNVEIVTLPGKNRFVWNLMTLPWFLLRYRVDVYHTQYILPFFVPKRTKVATHVHDVSFAAYPELISWSDRLFLGLLIPPSLSRAALVLAPSQFTKDEIVKHYHLPEEKVAVIPNALGDDFHAAHDDAGKEAAVREKYSLPETFLLSVGTLQPRKNIPFLIEAFARLKERLLASPGPGGPELKLVLVGSREAHHVDTRLSETMDRTRTGEDILFPGYVDQDDLPYLMRLSRGFVFPSLYEGFGIPLLEAFASGVPAAASDIPALREIGGQAALYFDPGNLAACAEVLYTVCTDEDTRARLCARGKERMRNFSWKKSAAFLLSCFEGLSSGDVEVHR